MYPIKSCNQNPTPSSYPLVFKFLKLEQMQFLKQKKIQTLGLKASVLFLEQNFSFFDKKI